MKIKYTRKTKDIHKAILITETSDENKEECFLYMEKLFFKNLYEQCEMKKIKINRIELPSEHQSRYYFVKSGTPTIIDCYFNKNEEFTKAKIIDDGERKVFEIVKKF